MREMRRKNHVAQVFQEVRVVATWLCFVLMDRLFQEVRIVAM